MQEDELQSGTRKLIYAGIREGKGGKGILSELGAWERDKWMRWRQVSCSHSSPTIPSSWRFASLHSHTHTHTILSLTLRSKETAELRERQQEAQAQRLFSIHSCPSFIHSGNILVVSEGSLVQ